MPTKQLYPPQLPSLTTTQRDALTATAGSMIYNSTRNTHEWYDGAAWHAVPVQLKSERGPTIASGTTSTSIFASAPSITPVAGDIYELRSTGQMTVVTTTAPITIVAQLGGNAIASPGATGNITTSATPRYYELLARIRFDTIGGAGTAKTTTYLRLWLSASTAGWAQDQANGTISFETESTIANNSGPYTLDLQIAQGNTAWSTAGRFAECIKRAI